MANLVKSKTLIHRQLFDRTYTAFRSQFNQQTSSSRVWYGWFSGGSTAKFSTNQGVCSAGIHQLDNSIKKRGVRLFPTIRPDLLKKDPDLCRKWYDWVTKESPFKSGLLCKSYAQTFTYGLWLNPKADTWYVHFAAQLLRQLSEHPYKLLVWKHLVEDWGVEPLQAYAASEFTHGSLTSIQLTTSTRHGDLFDKHSCSMKAFTRKAEEKGVEFGESRSSSYYNCGDGVFPSKGREKPMSTLVQSTSVDLDACKKELDSIKANVAEKVVAYINPFARATNSKGQSPEVVAFALYKIFFKEK